MEIMFRMYLSIHHFGKSLYLPQLQYITFSKKKNVPFMLQ